MDSPFLDRIAQLEEALEQAKAQTASANESRDLFLATLSHELRTPLTSILAWSQLLKLGGSISEEFRHGLDSIEQNARVQSQLIDDLLDLSRIQAGTLSLALTDVDATELVQGVVDALRPMAAGRKINIEIFEDARLGKVHVDPARTTQILWNLLTNALKFSTDGNWIRVFLTSIEEAGERFTSIRIVDQGKGIDAGFMPQLFSRFRQEDGSSTRVHNGLGIGLALVRDLVAMQGGRVTAESPGPGAGATFTVLLPDAKEVLPELTGLNVLLVDDEPSSLEVFTQLVHAFGGTPISCSSAGAAWAEFQRRRLDVVVSDIAMPVEDGYGLIRRIRALPPERGGRVPAIALTAFTAEHDVARTAAAGFQRHLPKPVDARTFGHAIARLAARPETRA